MATATLAAGCFWCYEPIFKSLSGVTKVTPGYSGGSPETANYEAISSGNTEHAEAFQVEFDPTQISFQEILDVFWHVHNPTTINQQGNDRGPQYRSAIFYHDQEQKQVAEGSKQRLEETHEFPDPIVTEIAEFTGFYPAEDYHQDYYSRNQFSSYAQYVIAPKLEKFKQRYSSKLAEEYI